MPKREHVPDLWLPIVTLILLVGYFVWAVMLCRHIDQIEERKAQEQSAKERHDGQAQR